jgi:hypothetical protein
MEEGVRVRSWQRLGAVVATCVVVAGTGASEAQELRDRDRTLAASRQIADDLRRARMHYGPFYLLSSIQLADIGYDQEFFVPVSDTSSGFRFGVAAPIRLYLTPNRKAYFSVGATPQWSRFGGAKAHNQAGYKTRADAQFLLNHLYLDAYAARDNELRADTGELSSLLTRKNKEVGVNGELKYSSRTSLTYSALARTQAFPLEANKFQPDFPVELLDRSEHAYRLAMVHKTFPLTSLFVAAEYAGYSFPNAVFKNSHRKYGGAGLLYESGRTTSRLEAGYSRLDFIRTNQKDFKGAVGNFGIQHRASDRWSVNGSAARDLSFSIFRDNNYYVASRASIGTAYGLTRHLSLNAAWTVIEDYYDVPTAGSKLNTVARRRDRMSFPSIGWTYSSPNRFTGGFDVGYLERTSNFPITEADGIRLILHLSLNL